MTTTDCKAPKLHHRVFPGTWVQHGYDEIFQIRSLNPTGRTCRLVSDHVGVKDRLVSFTELDDEYRQIHD